jgi:sodium-coupled monocarboxylate transporter 8/12
LQYNSAWISIIGGLLHWLSSYGLNQMAIQRYCSMPSLGDAQMVLWLAVPAIILIGKDIFVFLKNNNY